MSTMLDHVSAAFVEFENLLIAIIAGNTIAGSPSPFAAAWPSAWRAGIARFINTRLSL